MSNHADDPDRDPAAQLYVVEAKPGSTEKLRLQARARTFSTGVEPGWKVIVS